MEVSKQDLDELRSRGIDDVTDSQVTGQQEESADPHADPNVDLVTVARFSNPLEANVC